MDLLTCKKEKKGGESGGPPDIVALFRGSIQSRLWTFFFSSSIFIRVCVYVCVAIGFLFSLNFEIIQICVCFPPQMF